MASAPCQRLAVRIDHFTAQGGRSTQEDRVFLHLIQDAAGEPLAYFIAILDGHGGIETVDALLEMLPHSMPAFEYALLTGNVPMTQILENMCATLFSGTQQFVAGSTLTCALIDVHTKRMYAANLGDSVLMLARQGQVSFATHPHNARMHSTDRLELIARGAVWDEKEGYICNGPYSIQCSRALGDKLIPQLIRTPDVFTLNLKQGDTIMFATDGVITTNDDESYVDELIYFSKMLEDDEKLTAEELTYLGMEIRRASDNATTILVHIK